MEQTGGNKASLPQKTLGAVNGKRGAAQTCYCFDLTPRPAAVGRVEIQSTPYKDSEGTGE